MIAVLVLTHLAAFGAGVLAPRPVSYLLSRLSTRPRQEPVVSDTPNRSRRLSWPVSLLLAAALILGAFAVQQAFYQRDATAAARDAAARDDCYSRWGQRVVETITTRTDATGRLDQARQERDDAVDNVVLTVIALRRQPPPPNAEDQFSQVLLQFADAKARLTRVRRQVQATRQDNPYPVLNCDGDSHDEGEGQG